MQEFIAKGGMIGTTIGPKGTIEVDKDAVNYQKQLQDKKFEQEAMKMWMRMRNEVIGCRVLGFTHNTLHPATNYLQMSPLHLGVATQLIRATHMRRIPRLCVDCHSAHIQANVATKKNKESSGGLHA
ncbi:hypothetical protein PIB30_108956 [Stylosanthes scabra]|uniref:Uncharacterized protein n=1 Tax=Stylosanthes scabra TaxID=79078 RepID=A0ABU6ZYD6_9FABA|nr:hypothetical protein [Stylosanthes scabra]